MSLCLDDHEPGRAVHGPDVAVLGDDRDAARERR
jgi:hypothetical protein